MAERFAPLPETQLESSSSPAPKTNIGEFRKGLRSGVRQLETSARGTAAALSASIGDEQFAEEQIAEIDQVRQDSTQYQPRVSRFEDIHNMADLSDWLQGVAGTQLPVVAAIAAGGLGGLGIRSLITKRVPKELAVGLGIGTTSVGLETGSIFEEITSDPVAREKASLQDIGQASLTGGLAAGSLDALPIFRVFNQSGLGRTAQAGIRRNILTEIGKQAGLEAGTEGIQTIIERGTHKFINENIELFDEEGLSEILNAMAAGGVIGGGLGTVPAIINKLAAPIDEFDDALFDGDIEQEFQTRVLDALDPASPRFSRDLNDNTPKSLKLLRAAAKDPNAVTPEVVTLFKNIAFGDIELTPELYAGLSENFEDPETIISIFDSAFAEGAKNSLDDDDNIYEDFGDGLVDPETGEIVEIFQNNSDEDVAIALANATSPEFASTNAVYDIGAEVDNPVANLSLDAVNFINDEQYEQTSLGTRVEQDNVTARDQGLVMSTESLRTAINNIINRNEGKVSQAAFKERIGEIAATMYHRLRNRYKDDPLKLAKVEQMYERDVRFDSDGNIDASKFLDNFEVRATRKLPKEFNAADNLVFDTEKVLSVPKKTRSGQVKTAEGQMRVERTTEGGKSEMVFDFPKAVKQSLIALGYNTRNPSHKELSEAVANTLAVMTDSGVSVLDSKDMNDLKTVYRINGESIPFGEVSTRSKVMWAKNVLANNAKRIAALKSEINKFEKIENPTSKQKEGLERRKKTMERALNNARKATKILDTAKKERRDMSVAEYARQRIDRGRAYLGEDSSFEVNPHREEEASERTPEQRRAANRRVLFLLRRYRTQGTEISPKDLEQMFEIVKPPQTENRRGGEGSRDAVVRSEAFDRSNLEQLESLDNPTNRIDDEFQNRLPEESRNVATNHSTYTVAPENMKKVRGLRAREERLVSRIAKSIGIHVPTIMTPDQMLGSRTVRELLNDGVHAFAFPKDNIIVVNPNITDPDFRRELILHEIGHIVLDNVIMKPKIQEALFEEYNAWREKHLLNNSSVQEVNRSKKAFNSYLKILISDPASEINLSNLTEEQVEYVLDFHEWFADNTARWFESEAAPKTLLEKIFKQIADTFKKMFKMAKKQGYDSAESIADFYDGVVYRNKGMLIDQRRKVAGSRIVWPDDIRFSKETATDLMNLLTQPFSHNSTHSLKNLMAVLRKELTTEEKQVVGRVLGNKFLQRKVNNALRYHLRERYEAQVNPNYRLAVVYQLWLGGEIDLGPDTASVFSVFQDAVENLTGELQDHKIVTKLFEEIKMGKIGTARSAVEKNTEKARYQRAFSAVNKMFDRVAELFNAYINTADGFMHNTENPHLKEIANLFHHRTSSGEHLGKSYIEGKRDSVAAFRNKWHHIYKKYDDSVREEALELLQNPERYDGVEDGTPAKEMATEVRRLFRDLYNYQKRRGVKINDRGIDYFPWVFDVKYIAENRDRFFNFLLREEYLGSIQEIADALNKRFSNRRRPYTLEEVAGFIIDKITGADGILDIEFIDPLDEILPFSPSTKKRTLAFLYDKGTTEGRKILEEFFNKQIDRTIMDYIHNTVKHAEFVKRFGPEAEKLKLMMKRAKDYGATEQEMNLAGQYVEAIMGTQGSKTNASLHELFGTEAPKGQVVSPVVQQATGLLITIQNLALLSMATLTSLVDPVGIAVRGNSIHVAFRSLQAGFAEVINSVRGNETELRKLAESLGTIESKLTNEALQWEYGATWFDSRLKFVNEKFFQAIFLTQWTSLTRMMALQGAQEFIKKHMNSETDTSKRYIDELGLLPGDVRIDERGNLMVYTFAELNAEGEQALSKEERSRDQRVRTALNRFVDDAILRPDAAMRPLWASDPHYALIFHLKSFMYSFNDRILRRAVNELDEGEIGPLLFLMMYIPAMMAADLLRDMIKEAFGADISYKNNWTLSDRISSAAQRSGVTGLTQLLIDAQRDIQFGGIGIESLAGPSFEQLVFSNGNFRLDDLFFNNDKGTWKTVEDNLPLQNLNIWNFMIREGTELISD